MSGNGNGQALRSSVMSRAVRQAQDEARANGRQHVPLRITRATIRSVREDLALDPRCERFRLARAWIRGRYDCGCEYEGLWMSLEDCASDMGIEPDDLRAELLAGITIPAATCEPEPVGKTPVGRGRLQAART